MLVIPAIDLYASQVVRLREGKLDEKTVYSDDPTEPARQFLAEGAQWLHVVDLEGAFEGAPRNLDSVREIRDACGGALFIELGGGLRQPEDIDAAFHAGVDRVILGTKALEDWDYLEFLAADLQERLVVGLDARDGIVMVKGWVESGQLSALEAAQRCADVGVQRFIYTDISRDGNLIGPNLEAQRLFAKATPAACIASGGVATAADVAALAGLAVPNLEGVIVGKALYDGRATYPELLRAAGG